MGLPPKDPLALVITYIITPLILNGPYDPYTNHSYTNHPYTNHNYIDDL